MENKETKVGEQPINSKPLKQRKQQEISPEEKEERRLLTAYLLDKKEELVKERNERQKRIAETEIELRSGKKNICFIKRA